MTEHRERPGLMTPEEVAEFLKISRAAVYRFIEREGWPVVRFGRCTRIDPADLPEIIECHKHRGAA